jgi:hypothetical protein
VRGCASNSARYGGQHDDTEYFYGLSWLQQAITRDGHAPVHVHLRSIKVWSDVFVHGLQFTYSLTPLCADGRGLASSSAGIATISTPVAGRTDAPMREVHLGDHEYVIAFEGKAGAILDSLTIATTRTSHAGRFSSRIDCDENNSLKFLIALYLHPQTSRLRLVERRLGVQSQLCTQRDRGARSGFRRPRAQPHRVLRGTAAETRFGLLNLLSRYYYD